jgi:hypothetical protein
LRYFDCIDDVGFIGNGSAPGLVQPQALFLSGRLSCWPVGWLIGLLVGYPLVGWHLSVGWLALLVGWLVY